MIALALLAVAAVAVGRWLRHHRRLAATRTAARDLPRVVGELARSVRAGATLRTAVVHVAGRVDGAVGAELEVVVAATQRGAALDDALGAWRDRSSIVGVDLVVGACRFGVGHGGDLALALDGVAASLVDTLEVLDETRALAAQARTSAAVLVLLPPVGAGLFAVADPTVAQLLLGSAAGWTCVVVGLALDGLGALISSRMIRAALR